MAAVDSGILTSHAENPHPMNSPMMITGGAVHSELTEAFGLNHAKFAALGDGDTISHLLTQHQLLSLPIDDEIAQLNELNAQGHDGYLTITIPVVGLTDFLSSDHPWHTAPQAFGSVLAVNGYCAQIGTELDVNHSRPDFITVKDIIGNQFELTVNHDGWVDVPKDGLGKFSVLSEINLMFSKDQVLNGRGLAELNHPDAHPNSIHFLPPPDFVGKFSPILSVSKTLPDFSEEIVSSRKIPILVEEGAEKGPDFSVISRIDQDNHWLTFDLAGTLSKNQFGNKPFLLHLSLDPAMANTHPETQLNLSNESQSRGWQQTGSTEFTKAFGMSEQGLHSLVKHLFTELDFAKSIYSGDHFALNHQNGFNNFSLSPEAMGVFYDLWVHGVVNHNIAGDEFLNRINPDELQTLNVDELYLNSHDAHVLQAALQDVQHGSFKSFAELFSNEAHYHPVHDGLYLHVNGEMLSESPEAHAVAMMMDSSPIDVAHLSPIAIQEAHTSDIFGAGYDALVNASLNMGSTIVNLESTHAMYTLHNQDVIHLTPQHAATTLAYADILHFSDSGALINNFDMNQDKLDLTHLFENNPLLTPDQLRTELHGSDVRVSIMDAHSGASIPVATLVNAAPDHTLLPHDLTSFIHFHG